MKDCALFSLWNSPHHGRPNGKKRQKIKDLMFCSEQSNRSFRYNKINITLSDRLVVYKYYIPWEGHSRKYHPDYQPRRSNLKMHIKCEFLKNVILSHFLGANYDKHTEKIQSGEKQLE